MRQKKNNRMIYKFLKRAFDIISSGLAIIVTSPIWLIAAIGIEISDPGPIFYMANRISIHNKPFRMFKFRSMRVDDKANEKNFKADMNRIFKWGKIMRDTKIDELPQLLNVLFGDMSVVGPRPAAADQVSIVRGGKYEIVASIKPGLTGPAALYDYIYGDTIEDEVEYEEKVLPTRMELDAFYVGKMCIRYDIKIIWWTVVSIVKSIVHGDSHKIMEKLRGCVQVLSEYTVGK